MIRIVTIVGARPQFIKASVMSRFFSDKSEILETIVHTGQHFDENMSSIFFQELGIPAPSYNLDINNASHGNMTARMLSGAEEILIKENPDYVMVYGDTNSTLAGALAAVKLHIPVIHVEAGLRSFNMKMPEEINRILTDRISSLLCCPTDGAVANLSREGFDNFKCAVVKTGDVMEDAVRYFQNSFSNDSPTLESKVPKDEFVLCTVHREENTNDPARLSSIMEALEELSKHITIIVPLHPRTRAKLNPLPTNPTLHFLDPVSYTENLQLLKNCRLVITDSGGLQKEAYFFKKYCITIRNETEWTELVDYKCNVLAGADKRTIIESFHTLKEKAWFAPADIYGGGEAAEKIYDAIVAMSHQK